MKPKYIEEKRYELDDEFLMNIRSFGRAKALRIGAFLDKTIHQIDDVSGELQIFGGVIDDIDNEPPFFFEIELYKDEVRQIAKILGVPEKLFMRHPFPGPGLSVRIIGEITEAKLQISKIASKIVEEELMESGYYTKVWQAYAAVGDDKAVGVVGDERKYGNIVMIRVVDSIDAMTADWTRLPHGVLEKMSNRITNEIEDVTWVTYTISSKPPATIEPQ